MVVVANSTPLIALSRLGLFELLKEYFGRRYLLYCTAIFIFFILHTDDKKMNV